MERAFYLDLAAAGLRMPIGTHLVLHEHEAADVLLLDGNRLGEVVVEAAQRFATPLAVPLMDLTLEKSALLAACGVAETESEAYHFSGLPTEGTRIALTPRMTATCDALRYVGRETRLVPVGMCIGPFSLMTKLVSDPITPIFLAGAGTLAKDDPEVALVEGLITFTTQVVLDYAAAQLAAGAKALIVCEPAANQVFFSPNQLARSYEGFERFVMQPNRRVRDLLAEHQADLILHDCGELVDGMVSRLVTLDPAILSLGSSRRLWEDAALVPKTSVLYGNLPSKRFYSDELGIGEVERMSRELVQRMRAVEHPFILGTECDVLSVAGRERAITEKVEAFLRCQV